MKITSPAFHAQAEIPQQFTCEGANVSPPITIDADSTGAKSLAIVVDDPDSPSGGFVHWIVYNLPPSTQALPADATTDVLPPGAELGTNGFALVGWAGPCPRGAGRRHHYVFTLYALDEVLPDLEAPTKAELARAMRGHIIDEAKLVGTYQLKHEPMGSRT